MIYMGEYQFSMNKVMDYIDKNYFKKLTIAHLSQVAGYSTFHFHRLFHSMIDESLHQYILRIRLEKAALYILQNTATMTQVALDHGFYDSAAFSKHFKRHFGMSPSEYKEDSKNIQGKSQFFQYDNHEGTYICTATSLIYEKRQRLFYLRSQGDFRGNTKMFINLYEKVLAWKSKQKIQAGFQSKDIVLYHDPLEISPHDKLRISVGVTMPLSCNDQALNCLELEGGLYKVLSYVLRGNDYDWTWRHAYRQIIEDANLVLRDDYAYEVYPENCYDSIKNQTTFQIWIPVDKRREG